MIEIDISNYIVNLEVLLKNYFLSSKYDAGASSQNSLFVEETVDAIFLLHVNFLEDRVGSIFL